MRSGLEGFRIFLSSGLPSTSGRVSDFFRDWSARFGGFGLVLVCPTGLEGFRVFFKYWSAQQVWRGFGFFFRVLVCPKASRVLAWYWSAQRVWKGFAFFSSTGLPNRFGGVSDFFFSSTGLPKGPGIFGLVLVCPTGLEGFRIFLSSGLPTRLEGFRIFFRVLVCPKVSGVLAWYWSAQRVWKGFAFFSSTGLPNRSGGVSDFFSSTGVPKGFGGFGLVLVCPTGLEGFRFFFKYWPAQQVWRGFGFFFRVLVCPKGPAFLT